MLCITVRYALYYCSILSSTTYRCDHLLVKLGVRALLAAGAHHVDLSMMNASVRSLLTKPEGDDLIPIAAGNPRTLTIDQAIHEQ